MKKALDRQIVTFEVTSKEKLRYLAGPLLATGSLTFLVVFGMLTSRPWYIKVMLSTVLLPILIISYILKYSGEFNGRRKVRFSNEGVAYLNPLSNLDRWVNRHLLKFSTPEAEYVFIPWNGLHRIDCSDRRKEDRKKNGSLCPEPQIIFSYLDGKEFILYHGVFPDASRFNSKKRMIYEELKKEATERGIPFTTELESEESWTGPIFIRE